MTGIRIEITDSGAISGFRRIISQLDNPRPIFDQIGGRLVDSTKHRFEIESGPNGARWKPSIRALREGGKTLRKSGDLFRSLTHNVLSDGIEIGTNIVYAAIHQFGGKTPPRIIRPKNKKALYWPGARHPVKQVNHPGSNIPARPFLGLDTADEAAIERIISRHLGIK